MSKLCITQTTERNVKESYTKDNPREREVTYAQYNLWFRELPVHLPLFPV